MAIVRKMRRYENCALIVLHLFSHSLSCQALLNEYQETAKSVIFLRSQVEMGPEPWTSGMYCLEEFVKIVFTSRERLTRSYNMLLTNSYNLSSPALEIQDGFAKIINEAISRSKEKGRRFFQIRTVFDNKQYARLKFGDSAVIYTDYYIIIVDNVDRLQVLMRDYVSRMVSWNPGARFLVLFNNALNRHSEDQVAMDIFSLLQKQYYVHQIGLLYATSEIDYSFSVMDYYNNANCRTIRITKIGECKNGQPQPNTAEIKRKLRKFETEIRIKNCTFQMCAAISAPFVEEDCQTGLELRIVDFMRNHLNFKIKQFCDEETRGVREENGTWTGLLGKLFDRDCDFIIGGFFPDNEVIENFWASDCYLYDSYTWFVKLADPRPAWMAIYHIFQDETWLCFIILLLITWIFWYFFVNMLPEPPNHKDFSLTGINAMAVSICVAVEERPKCFSSRIFFLALTIYGMNVVAIYTSQLITVFTDPGYLHQMHNLLEVLEAGIPFGGPDENQDWFENDEDMWIFENYNDTDLFIPNSHNLRTVKTGQRVLLASRMYVLQDRLADEIFAFPQSVFSSPLHIIMKVGFPLLTDFNWLIRAMRDHGIFQKIDSDFRYNNTYLNRIARMRPEFKEPAIVLTTDHLKGSFSILFMGVVGSVFLFIGELFYFWLLTPCSQTYAKWKSANKTVSMKSLKKQNKKNKNSKKKRRCWPFRNITFKAESRNGKVKKNRAKVNNSQRFGAETYKVDTIKSIRFTPVKRRCVGLHRFY